MLHWNPQTGSIWFKRADLDKATNIFSAKNFNGKVQFGIVNEGKLLTMIAVKKIIDSDFQGDADFIQEVEIISTLEEPGSFLLRT